MLILFGRLGLSRKIAGTEEASKCFVALALYDTAPNNLEFFDGLSALPSLRSPWTVRSFMAYLLYWAEGALDRVDGAMKDSV